MRRCRTCFGSIVSTVERKINIFKSFRLSLAKKGAVADPKYLSAPAPYQSLNWLRLQLRNLGSDRLRLRCAVKKLFTDVFVRTAAAMAAFVGNHACVAVINNFITKEDIWYYTR